MSKSTTTALEIIQHIQGITIPGSTDRFLQTANGVFGLAGTTYLHHLRDGNVITNLSLRIHSRSVIGSGPEQKIGTLFVEVDARKRGRIRTAFSTVKVDLAHKDWPEKLSNAIVSGYFIQQTRHQNNVASTNAKKTAEQSREGFANSLTELLGHKVYSWNVTHGADGLPTGLKVEVFVTGTPEKVAQKILQIKRITV